MELRHLSTQGGTLTDMTTSLCASSFAQKLGLSDAVAKTGVINILPLESSILMKGESRGEKAVGILIRTVETNAYAHTVEAEAKAQELLQTHISKEQWADYFVSGCFWEVSDHSGNLYLFRKGFPTILCDCEVVDEKYVVTPKRTLCAHAISYTAGTFSGGLCPTDDVIVHLLMMRTDESHYLASCNPHEFDAPQSGV